MRRLLLLGGGHAHVHVLQALAAEPLPSAQVTLVSPFARLLYSGMVPGFVAGHYALEDCVIPLAALAQRAQVTLIESSANGLDAARREVSLADGRHLPYDTLSLDTGPVMDREAIPGAREHALFVRPIETFVQQWDALLALARDRALHVVMIGGGAAGVELALAMQYRLGERARLSLVTGGGPPLSNYPPRVQRRVLSALKRERITVLEDSCISIDAQGITLGRGTRLACDAPVLALGSAAPAWLAGGGLTLDTQGFIATGATLQSVSHAEVFAVGDVATRSDQAVPKSGVYAVRAGPALALNLRRHLAGGALEPHSPSARSLNLLACGRQEAIAVWGRWSAQGHWVWRWKDRIDRAFVERHRVEAASSG